MAAHPHDEVLDLGGHFQMINPRLFHVTNGARGGDVRSEKLAAVRAKELPHEWPVAVLHLIVAFEAT